ALLGIWEGKLRVQLGDRALGIGALVEESDRRIGFGVFGDLNLKLLKCALVGVALLFQIFALRMAQAWAGLNCRSPDIPLAVAQRAVEVRSEPCYDTLNRRGEVRLIAQVLAQELLDQRVRLALDLLGEHERKLVGQFIQSRLGGISATLPRGG